MNRPRAAALLTVLGVALCDTPTAVAQSQRGVPEPQAPPTRGAPEPQPPATRDAPPGLEMDAAREDAEFRRLQASVEQALKSCRDAGAGPPDEQRKCRKLLGQKITEVDRAQQRLSARLTDKGEHEKIAGGVMGEALSEYLAELVDASRGLSTKSQSSHLPPYLHEDSKFTGPGYDDVRPDENYWSSCARVCAEDDRCKAWTFKPGWGFVSRHCWLHDWVPDHRYCNDCTSGVKLLVETGPAPTPPLMEIDTERPGADYRNFALDDADPTLCRKACSKDPDCKAWTYRKPELPGDQARCLLADRVTQPRSDVCCVSGLGSTTRGAAR